MIIEKRANLTRYETKSGKTPEMPQYSYGSEKIGEINSWISSNKL